MTDRVHPRNFSPEQAIPKVPTENMAVQEKSVNPTGTYVVQIPKDQIYRIPPPENARRYEKLSRRNTRRNPCCCCCCWLISIIAVIVLLSAIAAVAFYFVFKPKVPNYTVDDISIKGFNLTSSSSSSDLTISPEFDVTVRAENPNKKIGIYYEKGSNVSVSHSTTNLCSGNLPNFFQPKNNVTIFKTALKSSGIKLTAGVHDTLLDEQRKGKIPLGLDLKVPVRLKVGPIKTWMITVRVHCDIIVNKLAMDSKIVSKKCDVDPKVWKKGD